MALCYFAEQKCDVVIWKPVSRPLDATNIVTPLVSVITISRLITNNGSVEPSPASLLKKRDYKPGIPCDAATDPAAQQVIEETVAQTGADDPGFQRILFPTLT